METWEIDTDCNIIYYEKNGIRTDICKILQTDMPPDEANQKARTMSRACNNFDGLLEACKELLALWWDAKVACRNPQCGVCKQNRKFHKKFSDIIAKAEKP